MKDFTNRSFNPSADPRVDEIKEAAERLCALISVVCPAGPLKDRAVLDVVSGSMFAIKSLFAK